jgi:hypothetical protein
MELEQLRTANYPAAVAGFPELASAAAVGLFLG